MSLNLDPNHRIRIGKDPESSIGSGWNPLDPTIESLARAHDHDDRRLRLGLIAAVVVHLVLFAVTWPQWSQPPQAVASSQQVFVVSQVRFQKPQPRAAQEVAVQQPKARKIPIPDPTPDDPEPIREELPSLTDVVADVVAEAGDVFGIPDGPPTSGPASGALNIGGDVLPPQKVHAPQPRYTEDARKARIEGVVILQTVVDTEGKIVDVKVLKGLPYGLTESATQTVREWRFKPATKQGQPVPVFYMLTVTFSIQ